MKTIITLPTPPYKLIKNWWKTLTSVDYEQSNDQAFQGSFLKEGERAELEIGSFVFRYYEPDWPGQLFLAFVYRVEKDDLITVYSYAGKINEKSWALGCRDGIAQVLMEWQEFNRYKLTGYEIVLEENYNHKWNLHVSCSMVDTYETLEEAMTAAIRHAAREDTTKGTAEGLSCRKKITNN